ncbi:helix-turn-helix transcriptional regulator [Streptomyces sp. R302]|nr:helix-turn-helix transcriptional regulator [Streptomyces sp. R301]NML83566.1 helix-turn-helix transcriptional regulator [Streptomyces sp. R302]
MLLGSGRQRLSASGPPLPKSWPFPRSHRFPCSQSSVCSRDRCGIRRHQSSCGPGRCCRYRRSCSPALSGPGVEQLIGLDRIRDRLATLTREVREELLGLNTDGAQTVDAMEASRPLDQELLDRGVRMRTVYLDSVRNDEPTLAYADWLTTGGAQVRTAPVLPTRMIVVDRKTAVIPLTSQDTAAGAVVLTSDGLVTALCALFETIWATAQPLGSGSAPDDHGLTAQQNATLQLLAAGHTDDAIAKRLGVSSRTARRIATDLMDRLGARSRFEAGARAAQQGWLAPTP